MADYLIEESNHLQNLERRLKEAKDVNVPALARTDIPHGYADAMPLFEMVMNQILDVKALPLSSVPYGQIETAAGAIEEATRLFNTILHTIAPSSADATHHNITRIRDHWRTSLAPALSNLQRYAWTDSSTQKMANKLAVLETRLESSAIDAGHAISEALQEKNRIATEYDTFSNDAASKIDELAKEGAELTNKLKETLAGFGAAEYMKRFEEEATHHRVSSWCWLGLTIAFAVLILLAGLHFISTERQTIEEAIKHGVSVAIATVSTRVLVMSILSIGLFVSLRNYSACRHNFIVNKHRINLGTFKVFTGAADDETRKVVLLQAMKAVIDPQDTGYLKSAGEPQHGTQIIELIQSGLTKSGGTHN